MGIGFALVVKVKGTWVALSEKELKGKGVHLSKEQYETIVKYAKVKSDGNKPSTTLKSELQNMDLGLTTRWLRVYYAIQLMKVIEK